MITSFEFHSTALAIATDWRWPPDSDATGWRIERTVVTARLAQRLARRLLHARPRRAASRGVPARDRGTCSGRCRGCRTARGPGRRSRCRARRRRAGVRMWTRLPFQRISPRVGRVDAGDALDQHRLAGAVVADERGDLPGGDVEVDVRERLHGAEALADARAAESSAASVQPRRVRCTSLDPGCGAGGGDAPRRTASDAVTNSVLDDGVGHVVGRDPLPASAAPTGRRCSSVVSLVVPFTSAAGGFSPARR